jgi:hypothetical protein
MNKNKRIALFVGVVISTVLVGCNKLEDYLKDDPLATYDQCRVEKMFWNYSGSLLEMNVTYNKHGDPVSVMNVQGGTGSPNMLFKYDNKRRLTDYIIAYSNGGFEQWHQYVYDNKGRVIRDTAYMLGWNDNGVPADYYDGAVIYYEYDQYGRIIHTSQDWWSYPDNPLETYYSYDAQGNQVVPGAVYDNKISIHRTHRIWMFIDRNYSLNNCHATAYNANNLPTNLALGWPNPSGTKFAGYYVGTLDSIVYKCK